MRILIAEDDARLRSLLERVLRESGYAVNAFEDADAALFAAQTDAVDLLILDIMIPGSIDGLELCRTVREQDPSTPILLLTALDAPAHRVRGLDSGADDYLTKPFHLPELLARVRALMRRAPLAVTPTLTAAGITMDTAARTVVRDDRLIDLTAREFAVLELLMRVPGRVITASEFLDHAWDANYDGYSNVVASTIRHLRGKLAVPGLDDPISTRRGSGYVLSADAGESPR